MDLMESRKAGLQRQLFWAFKTIKEPKTCQNPRAMSSFLMSTPQRQGQPLTLGHLGKSWALVSSMLLGSWQVAARLVNQ